MLLLFAIISIVIIMFYLFEQRPKWKVFKMHS